MTTSQRPIIIAVGGGKGGVGKSVVAANLAIAIARLGFRTALVDADFGAANQHTLFGIDRPGRSIQALLDREVKTLEELSTPSGISRLFLIPGVGAIPGAANIPYAQKMKVLRHITKLDSEVVLVDVGAGVSFNVLDFFLIGDHRLIVTSPQLPSIQNAYCFLKAAVYRDLKTRLDTKERKAMFREAWRRSETERMSEARKRAYELDPSLDAAFHQATAGVGARIIGNMLEHAGQLRVLHALSRMCTDFLDCSIPATTGMLMSRALHQSVTTRRPIAISQPSHEFVRKLDAIAESLMTADVQRLRKLREANAPARSKTKVGRVTQDQRRSALGPLIDYLRQDERIAVEHDVEVSTTTSPKMRAQLSDVSKRGVAISGQIALEIGDQVEICITGFPDRPTLRGTVRHVAVSNTDFGIELDESAHHVANWLLSPQTPRRTQTLDRTSASVANAS